LPSPSFDERWHAGAHLAYEFDQLSAMYVVLARLELGETICEEDVRETLRLATMESRLGHARCVIEFLIGRFRGADQSRRRNGADIPPTWFASNWPTTSGSHRLDRWLELIDVNIAHLSKKRISMNELGDHDAVEWTTTMFAELADEIEGFVNDVADVASRDVFARSLTRLRDAIEEYPDLETGS